MVKLPGELFAIAGSVPPRVIVPLTLNLMITVPSPTEQSPPVVSTPGLFALLIASRRLQNPSPEVLESLTVFTINLCIDEVTLNVFEKPRLARSDWE